MMEMVRAKAGEGANWYVRGWRLFVKKPIFWVSVFMVPLAAAVVLLWAFPRLGSLALSLLSPAIGAGFYQAARIAEEGGEPDPSVLWAGFSRQEARGSLLVLGILATAVTLAADLISRRLVGASLAGMGEAMPMPHAGSGSLFALLIMLALEIAVALAFFYAVPLVWFKGVAPGEAIKTSFNAGLENFVPLLLFGLIGSVLMVLALLPLMLGLPLLLPVMFLAMYCSYRSLFPD